MLNTRGTVTAVAGAAGLKAREIPKIYISRPAKKEPVKLLYGRRPNSD